MSRIKQASSADVDTAVSRLTGKTADYRDKSYPIETDQLYSQAEQEEAIWEAMQTEEGRRLIGAQMAVPIRTQLDYQGVARKFFEIDVLKPGEIARYDKDVTSIATVVAKRSEIIQPFKINDIEIKSINAAIILFAITGNFIVHTTVLF